MKKFFYCFAIAGWSLALAFILLTFANIELAEKLRFIWIMHIGVLVVWIFIIIMLRNNKEKSEIPHAERPSSFNIFPSIRALTRNAPVWLRTIAISCVVFMFVNFLLFVLTQHGSPAIMKGEFVLHSHGKIIRILTEREYLHYRANELRAFSGLWLGLYGLAAAILYPYVSAKA